MRLADHIKKNSFYSFSSQAIRLLANVVIFIVVARWYGPSDFGSFTAAHTLATLFVLLADFGFDLLVSSEVARNRSRAQEIGQVYFSMKVLFGVAAFVGMVAFAILQPGSESTRDIMLVFAFYMLFSTLSNFFFALYKGFEELHHETRISLIMNGVLLAGVSVLGVLHVPIVWLALVFALSRLLGVVIALPVAGKLVSLRRFEFTLASRSEVAMISVFGFHAIFGNMFFIQDTILLSWWAGDVEVGIYQAAFKLMSLVLVLPDVVIAALIPTLSRLNEDDMGLWRRTGQLMNKTFLFLGVPISFLLFVFPEQIISAVYGGSAYSGSEWVLRVFGIVVLVRYSVASYAVVLMTSRRVKLRLFNVFGATVLNLVLNAVGIPRFGFKGAAIVCLITNISVGIGDVLASRPLFKEWMLNRQVAMLTLISVPMLMVLWEFRLTAFWMAIPLVMASYGLFAYFVGYSREERNLLFRRGV